MYICLAFNLLWGCRGHDHMVVRIKTIWAISAYHHISCEVRISLYRSVLDTTLHVFVYVTTFCKWLTTGRWFSPGTRVSSTNKTDCHDIAEVLLKVVLNTIIIVPGSYKKIQFYFWCMLFMIYTDGQIQTLSSIKL